MPNHEPVIGVRVLQHRVGDRNVVFDLTRDGDPCRWRCCGLRAAAPCLRASAFSCAWCCRDCCRPPTSTTASAALTCCGRLSLSRSLAGWWGLSHGDYSDCYENRDD